jgi:hypothetical protein
MILQVITYMKTEFKVTDGEVDYFVGFQIHQDPVTFDIFIHQSRYIDDILNRFGFTDVNPVVCPSDPHVRLMKGDDDTDPITTEPFSEALGCLMYAMIISRPDMSYAVCKASSYQAKPRASHWAALKRIFRYLKGTKSWGICYSGQPRIMQLIGYSDSDFGGDLDCQKSRTGYVYLYGDSAISWASIQQGTVADSTTVAELYAMAMTSKEAYWLGSLLDTLHLPCSRPLSILCDNQGAIALVKNPVYHKRTKHVDLKYFFVREFLERNQVDYIYVNTKDQAADAFTKPLPRDSFHKF